MKPLTSIAVILGLMSVLCSPMLMADEDQQKLFINLSSDEINRATMAISFSTRVLKQKNIPVTIFLNVEGVRIADTSLPSHQHASGKSPRDLLKEFMQAGGRVIICPMCMDNVGGIDKQQLLEGVEMGGPDVTWPALFADDTTVLSY